jgi:hypothetical protein
VLPPSPSASTAQRDRPLQLPAAQGRQPIELEVFGNRTEFDGRPAIIGMLVDITARCAAERTANEQLNFIGQLIEAIPSPLFFKDERPATSAATRPSKPSSAPRDESSAARCSTSPARTGRPLPRSRPGPVRHPGVQTYEASVEAADGMRRDVIFNKATWLQGRRQPGRAGGRHHRHHRAQADRSPDLDAGQLRPLTGLPNRRLLNDRLAER